MTLTNTDPTTDILDAIVEHVRPFVEQAARAAGGRPDHVAALISTDPAIVSVVFTTAGQTRRVACEPADEALARAVSEFLRDGLNRLPAEARRRTIDLVHGGWAELTVVLNLMDRGAIGLLVPHVAGGEPIRLFTLSLDQHPVIIH